MGVPLGTASVDRRGREQEVSCVSQNYRNGDLIEIKGVFKKINYFLLFY